MAGASSCRAMPRRPIPASTAAAVLRPVFSRSGISLVVSGVGRASEQSDNGRCGPFQRGRSALRPHRFLGRLSAYAPVASTWRRSSAITASNIAGVSRPVLVFWREQW